MKGILCFIILSLAFGCEPPPVASEKPVVEGYDFVAMDSSSFDTKQQVYAPVYSSIYTRPGANEFLLAAMLSIRNISFSDTIYVTKVNYYGSNGELLLKYIDSAILLKPMASVEMFVKESEKKGKAGANFVVEWMGNKITNKPLIQTIMTGNDNRLAFTANGVEIVRDTAK